MSIVDRLREYHRGEGRGWPIMSEAADRIDELEELLERCAECLDNYSDTVDGDYGVPEPNRALRMYSEIMAVLK